MSSQATIGLKEMQSFSQLTERSNTVDTFIGVCLMSVTYMHSAHFATRSYAQHKAFEDFYTEMQDLVDTFTETHIGITGSYKPVIKVENVVDTVQYLRKIAAIGDEIYPSVDSALKNIIDEIKSLCYRTIYKLTQFT